MPDKTVDKNTPDSSSASICEDTIDDSKDTTLIENIVSTSVDSSLPGELVSSVDFDGSLNWSNLSISLDQHFLKDNEFSLSPGNSSVSSTTDLSLLKSYIHDSKKYSIDDNHYKLGDLIWSKVKRSLPLWPCVITYDPISKKMINKKSFRNVTFTNYYHVNYFGDNGSRSWVPANYIMPFDGKDHYEKITESCKLLPAKLKVALKYYIQGFALQKHLKPKLYKAIEEAEQFVDKSVEERLIFFENINKSKQNKKKSKKNAKKKVSEANFSKINSETSFEETKTVVEKRRSKKIKQIDDDATSNYKITTNGLVNGKSNKIAKKRKLDNESKQEKRYAHLFKGVTKDNICEVCETAGEVYKCEGVCLRYFHVKCFNKYISKLNRKNNDDNNDTMSNPDSEINSMCDSETCSEVSSIASEVCCLNDDKSSDEIFINNNDSENGFAMSDELENLVKLEKTDDLMEVNSEISQDDIDYLSHVKAKSSSSDSYNDSFDNESKSDSFTSQAKRKRIETSCVGEMRVEIENTCVDCTSKRKPPCFICGQYNLNDINCLSPRFRCSILSCGRYYHMSCLKFWPQTIYTSRIKEKNLNNYGDFTCPLHCCHICVSDNPRSLSNRSTSDKLVQCIRCPSSYHFGNYCIPAGSIILSNKKIICAKHSSKKKHRQHLDNNEKSLNKKRSYKKDLSINVNWCSICTVGGSLICCENCPNSFHMECLGRKSVPEDRYICDDCESGRLPLYNEIVWAKLGSYRWWPAKILYPWEIPLTLENRVKKMGAGEFCIFFYGTHDYYLINRIRTFLYNEGDDSPKTFARKKNSMEISFALALEEAAKDFKELEDEKFQRGLSAKSNCQPPPYIKIKSNKYLYKNTDLDNSISACNCSPKDKDPCGATSNCLNRLINIECSPEICPASDTCNNRNFEKKCYPKVEPFKTNGRGWGLRCLESIKKGQFVIEYVGEVISSEEGRRRFKIMHEQQMENFYIITLDFHSMIDAGEKGNYARFMNHSCSPNCCTQKWTVNGQTRIGLFALKDIEPNHELTFNYLLEQVGTSLKTCMCQAPNCSGYIGVKVKDTEKNEIGIKKSKNSKKKLNGVIMKPKVSKNQLKFENEIKSEIEIKSENKVKSEDYVKSKDDDDVKIKTEIKCEMEITRLPCFCGLPNSNIICALKTCHRSYHSECLKTRITRNWICPKHQCENCSNRNNLMMCSKCYNSYCYADLKKHLKSCKETGNAKKSTKNNIYCSTNNHAVVDNSECSVIFDSNTRENSEDVNLIISGNNVIWKENFDKKENLESKIDDVIYIEEENNESKNEKLINSAIKKDHLQQFSNNICVEDSKNVNDLKSCTNNQVIFSENSANVNDIKNFENNVIAEYSENVKDNFKSCMNNDVIYIEDSDNVNDSSENSVKQSVELIKTDQNLRQLLKIKSEKSPQKVNLKTCVNELIYIEDSEDESDSKSSVNNNVNFNEDSKNLENKASTDYANISPEEPENMPNSTLGDDDVICIESSEKISNCNEVLNVDTNLKEKQRSSFLKQTPIEKLLEADSNIKLRLRPRADSPKIVSKKSTAPNTLDQTQLNSSIKLINTDLTNCEIINIDDDDDDITNLIKNQKSNILIGISNETYNNVPILLQIPDINSSTLTKTDNNLKASDLLTSSSIINEKLPLDILNNGNNYLLAHANNETSNDRNNETNNNQNDDRNIETNIDINAVKNYFNSINPCLDTTKLLIDNHLTNNKINKGKRQKKSNNKFVTIDLTTDDSNNLTINKRTLRNRNSSRLIPKTVEVKKMESSFTFNKQSVIVKTVDNKHVDEPILNIVENNKTEQGSACFNVAHGLSNSLKIFTYKGVVRNIGAGLNNISVEVKNNLNCDFNQYKDSNNFQGNCSTSNSSIKDINLNSSLNNGLSNSKDLSNDINPSKNNDSETFEKLPSTMISQKLDQNFEKIHKEQNSTKSDLIHKHSLKNNVTTNFFVKNNQTKIDNNPKLNDPNSTNDISKSDLLIESSKKSPSDNTVNKPLVNNLEYNNIDNTSSSSKENSLDEININHSESKNVQGPLQFTHILTNDQNSIDQNNKNACVDNSFSYDITINDTKCSKTSDSICEVQSTIESSNKSILSKSKILETDYFNGFTRPNFEYERSKLKSYKQYLDETILKIKTLYTGLSSDASIKKVMRNLTDTNLNRIKSDQKIRAHLNRRHYQSKIKPGEKRTYSNELVRLIDTNPANKFKEHNPEIKLMNGKYYFRDTSEVKANVKKIIQRPAIFNKMKNVQQEIKNKKTKVGSYKKIVLSPKNSKVQQQYKNDKTNDDNLLEYLNIFNLENLQHHRRRSRATKPKKFSSETISNNIENQSNKETHLIEQIRTTFNKREIDNFFKKEIKKIIYLNGLELSPSTNALNNKQLEFSQHDVEDSEDNSDSSKQCICGKIEELSNSIEKKLKEDDDGVLNNNLDNLNPPMLVFDNKFLSEVNSIEKVKNRICELSLKQICDNSVINKEKNVDKKKSSLPVDINVDKNETREKIDNKNVKKNKRNFVSLNKTRNKDDSVVGNLNKFETNLSSNGNLSLIGNETMNKQLNGAVKQYINRRKSKFISNQEISNSTLNNKKIINNFKTNLISNEEQNGKDLVDDKLKINGQNNNGPLNYDEHIQTIQKFPINKKQKNKINQIVINKQEETNTNFVTQQPISNSIVKNIYYLKNNHKTNEKQKKRKTMEEQYKIKELSKQLDLIINKNEVALINCKTKMKQLKKRNETSKQKNSLQIEQFIVPSESFCQSSSSKHFDLNCGDLIKQQINKNKFYLTPGKFKKVLNSYKLQNQFLKNQLRKTTTCAQTSIGSFANDQICIDLTEKDSTNCSNVLIDLTTDDQNEKMEALIDLTSDDLSTDLCDSSSSTKMNKKLNKKNDNFERILNKLKANHQINIKRKSNGTNGNFKLKMLNDIEKLSTEVELKKNEQNFDEQEKRKNIEIVTNSTNNEHEKLSKNFLAFPNGNTAIEANVPNDVKRVEKKPVVLINHKNCIDYLTHVSKDKCLLDQFIHMIDK